MSDTKTNGKTSLADLKEPIAAFAPDEVRLIRQTVARDAASVSELTWFLTVARKTGLDPLTRQLHFTTRKDGASGDRRPVFITGIDGYRTIAARTGEYAGSDDAAFDGEIKGGGGVFPRKATVTVYRLVKGHRCPFTASARWSEYCPSGKAAYMWNRMPHVLLAKVAEALALRKGFPAELSEVYTDTEMEQAAEQPAANAQPAAFAGDDAGKNRTVVEHKPAAPAPKPEPPPETKPGKLTGDPAADFDGYPGLPDAAPESAAPPPKAEPPAKPKATPPAKPPTKPKATPPAKPQPATDSTMPSREEIEAYRAALGKGVSEL